MCHDESGSRFLFSERYWAATARLSAGETEAIRIFSWEAIWPMAVFSLTAQCGEWDGGQSQAGFDDNLLTVGTLGVRTNLCGPSSSHTEDVVLLAEISLWPLS